jgi:hypothetical protein
MSAHALYVDQGPYGPISEHKTLLKGRVTPISGTMVKPSNSGTFYDLRATDGVANFDAGSNLESVLSKLRSQDASDPETLAAACSALARMRVRENEDTQEWAEVLAGDSASIHD